jgi:hypothetical protein
MRQRRTCDIHNAEEIDVDLLVKFLLGEFLDRADMAISGIVENHVDPPEMRHSRIDCFVCATASVTSRCSASALVSSARQSTNGINVAGGGHQLITAIKNGLAHDPAKATGGSSHTRYAVSAGAPRCSLPSFRNARVGKVSDICHMHRNGMGSGLVPCAVSRALAEPEFTPGSRRGDSGSGSQRRSKYARALAREFRKFSFRGPAPVRLKVAKLISCGVPRPAAQPYTTPAAAWFARTEVRRAILTKKESSRLASLNHPADIHVSVTWNKSGHTPIMSSDLILFNNWVIRFCITLRVMMRRT